MMKVRQRLERLEEELLPPSAVLPIVHHINFIDDDGKTTETMQSLEWEYGAVTRQSSFDPQFGRLPTRDRLAA
jgi:hypothetical protein